MFIQNYKASQSREHWFGLRLIKFVQLNCDTLGVEEAEIWFGSILCQRETGSLEGVSVTLVLSLIST